MYTGRKGGCWKPSRPLAQQRKLIGNYLWDFLETENNNYLSTRSGESHENRDLLLIVKIIITVLSQVIVVCQKEIATKWKRKKTKKHRLLWCNERVSDLLFIFLRKIGEERLVKIYNFDVWMEEIRHSTDAYKRL